MDNHKLTARDLLKDEYFLAWVLNPDPENTLYWENWITRHPHLKPEVNKALKLLSSDAPMVLPDRKVERIWDNIATGTGERKEIPVIPIRQPEKRPGFPTWSKVAAVFIGILLAGGLWKYAHHTAPRMMVSTGFGETRKVILPDNSVAVLNGNSSLAYEKGWEKKAREVVLEGEAFFSVTHTKDDRPFRVKMNDSVRVEVLGTKFTVTNRLRKARVVLSEGKVKVADEFMKPGELLQLERGHWEKRTIENPENYAAFLHDEIIFKDTPLSEVARLLEDNYGYTVHFATASLTARSFTGACPHNRVDLLLKAIGRVFNLDIRQIGKEIKIRQK